MTPERLREIISGGESLTVQFKGKEKSPLSDNDLLEAVVCLANRSKEDLGWLMVGIEDDGRVIGAGPHQGNSTDPLRVQALIANRTRPNLNHLLLLNHISWEHRLTAAHATQIIQKPDTEGRAVLEHLVER